MDPLHLPPTDFDIAIAKSVERRATPAGERPMRVVTWLADEHLLYAASALVWFISRRGTPRQRMQAGHLALSIALANVLPHLLKQAVDQERPDRYVHAPRHGIPKSGKPQDAFPSGHAVHIGAVASALSWMYPRAAPWVWLGGVALAGTRVVLLAHWTSDVLAGLLTGAGLERVLRPLSMRLFGTHAHRRHVTRR